MHFYSAETVQSQSLDVSRLFPIYLDKKIIEDGNVRRTKLKLGREMGGDVYAYCDQADFEISDLFKADLHSDGTKQMVTQTTKSSIKPEKKAEKENTQNTPRSNATTVKKAKQTSLFSFMKNKSK